MKRSRHVSSSKEGQAASPLPNSLSHKPDSPASQASTTHLESWAMREMEARRLAVAAAGQGAVGLRSLGGRRRLARKASG
jgi:hypothetical protein